MIALNVEPRFTALSNQDSMGNNSKCLFTKWPSVNTWEDISSILCYLKKSWSQMASKDFQQSAGNCPFLWCKCVPFCASPFLGRAPIVGVWAGTCEVVHHFSTAKGVLVACTDSPETPVPLAGGHPKPGCGSHAIVDVRPLPGVLISVWACCQMAIPPSNTVTAC